MKYLSRQIISLGLALSLLIGLITFSPSGLAHASGETPQNLRPTTAKPVTVKAEWITQADPYVHVVNYVASVDPEIAKHLSSQLVAQVNTMVANYNQVSRPAREHGVSYVAKADARYTSPQWSQWGYTINVYYHWWGVTAYLNEPFIQAIVSALRGVGGASWVLSVLSGCPPCSAVAVGIIIYAFWLIAADVWCGGRGANLNRSWTGSAWVTGAC